MSAKDLSILSYKELQALAVKHRVPGNIKKLLLVKILHAVKCGNSSEVTRLLTDLKKNRKKRTKRMKIMKADDDGSVKIALHNDSPDLPTQEDHYLFPIQQHQQQYPFQWLDDSQVGAEEEVGTSKYEDLRCNLSYNDIRQLVLYTSHGVYGNCDTNNNSTLLDEIMDLRTEATVSNYRSSMEATHINNTSQEQQIVQPLVDESTSRKMSLLLKKMLQAPVGANLGEIASPVETWSMDTYRLREREQSPDNSETMTAKSDINENDEIWQDNVTVPVTGLPCVFENEQSYSDNSFFRRGNNITSLYRSSLDNSGEQNSLQGYEQQQQQQTCNPYQFNFVTQADAQENCRSWLASNSLDITNPTEYGTTSVTRLEPTVSVQYQSPENADLMNPSPGDASNIVQTNTQYCITADQLYSNQGSSSMVEPSELVPDLQFDASRFYQTPSSIVRQPEPQDYYRQICAAADGTSFSQDLYETQQQQQQQQQQQPSQQQQQSNEQSHQSRYSDYAQQLAAAVITTPIYHVELDNATYDPGYYQEQQQNIVPNQPSVVSIGAEPLQQVQNTQFENYVVAPGPTTVQNNLHTTYGSAALDPYWPRWSYPDHNTASTMGGRSLENTLNLCTTNYVDYTKLNETCCVYSNKTPVMTLRKGLNSVPSSLENRSTSGGCNSTEYRQHNFASNWLLYNDDTGLDVNTKRKDFAQTPPTSLSGYCSVEQRSDTIM